MSNDIDYALTICKEQILNTIGSGTYKNVWIHDPSYGAMYIRVRSVRLYDGQPIRMFDFANISLKPGIRNRGFMKNLIKWVQQILPNVGMDAIYVESILNEGWYWSLIREGGIRTGPVEDSNLVFFPTTPSVTVVPPRQDELLHISQSF